jgi:outer membrane protein assembly factor BamB
LIVGKHVIVHVETQNTSFAVGIDLQTGKNEWRHDRPRQYCWTSPIALHGRAPGEPLVLLQGSTRLSALDPATGREVWGLDHASGPIASSVLAGDRLLVPGEKALRAFNVSVAGHAPKLLWEQARLDPETPSPIVRDGRVYAVRAAILVCGDLHTGKVLSQTRLHGPLAASPVVSGDLAILVSESGEVQIVRLTKMGATVVERADLHDTILGTPAIADGAVYLRSDKHLWRFGNAGARSH